MTAAEKSKFTKKEKERIMEGLFYLPNFRTVQSKRDFRQEAWLFEESEFSLRLWIACCVQKRWDEFGLAPQAFFIRKGVIAPDNLLGLLYKEHGEDICNMIKAELWKEEFDYEDVISPTTSSYNVIPIPSFDKTYNTYIKHYKRPSMYLPIWGFKYSLPFQRCDIYIRTEPILYISSYDTSDKTILLTNDLFSAYLNNKSWPVNHPQLRSCSFYSVDGRSDQVDFSCLKDEKLVIVVSPRLDSTAKEVFGDAMELYNSVTRYRAADVLFAVYVEPNYTDLTRLEPLLLSIDEFENMHARACGIRQENYTPLWACQALSSTPQKLIDRPELLTNSVISLSGGSQSTQLAFLAALIASFTNGTPILPDMKQVIGGPIYCVLGRDKVDELQDLCHAANALIGRNALIPDQSQPWVFNILPVEYGNFPETKWQWSGKLIDSQVNGPPYNKNVNAIIIDCQALEQTFEKLPEVSAEFCNYVHSLTARGFAVILLTYPRSWLAKSVSFAAKWRICNEKVAASGVSFTLSIAARRKIAIQYRVCFDPVLKWMRGARPALSEQIKKIKSLYRKNMKKPFGSGKHGSLTIQDLMNATGYSEPQVKKLRGLAGVAKKCPQRGVRKPKKVPVRYY